MQRSQGACEDGEGAREREYYEVHLDVGANECLLVFLTGSICEGMSVDMREYVC